VIFLCYQLRRLLMSSLIINPICLQIKEIRCNCAASAILQLCIHSKVITRRNFKAFYSLSRCKFISVLIALIDGQTRSQGVGIGGQTPLSIKKFLYSTRVFEKKYQIFRPPHYCFQAILLPPLSIVSSMESTLNLFGNVWVLFTNEYYEQYAKVNELFRN